MPRRSSARTANTPANPPPLPLPSPASSLPLPNNASILRTQWKWAAFSQFFHTFAPLLAMSDVSLVDIENDLVYGTNVFLPRVMQRLLYTLSYDRKISIDNWQSALRKQYYKRDPAANPIGPEPPRSFETQEGSVAGSALSTRPTTPEAPRRPQDVVTDGETTNRDASETATSEVHPENDVPSVDNTENMLREASIPDSDRGAQGGDGRPPEKESLDWLNLPMLVKLDSMHLLTEWQFQNPTRIRQLMKSDDETASWRIEPIGYDSKKNAYWHIGDRLWLQRPLPKPENTKKRKRVTTSITGTNSKAKATPAKRARILQKQITPKVSAQMSSFDTSASGGRSSRAAKSQAKLRLDAQAKELAELNRQAARQAHNSVSSSRSRRKVSSGSTSNPLTSVNARSVGTRISARLRGIQDEEWQPIPDEWLDESSNVRNIRKGANGVSVRKQAGTRKALVSKTGLESDSDSISDLTELSEEEISDRDVSMNEPNENVKPKHAADDDDILDNPPPPPEGFVEWETICVTLYDWEHIAERFEKATYYLEKALYKRLATDIVPRMAEELREIEKRRRLGEALSHRKRSSRLAIRENEKEEARLAAIRQAEEDEKMSRARRLEVRRQKEEEERVRREKAREQRRIEREARDASRKADPKGSEKHIPTNGEKSLDGSVKEITNASPQENKIKIVNGHVNGSTSGSRTPIGEEWELDCEICHRHGVNLDDGTPMMSCGMCSRWQHIRCHDEADYRAGRPKRDWDVVEFICRKCNSRKHNNSEGKKHLPPGMVYTSNPPNQQSVPQQHQYSLAYFPAAGHDNQRGRVAPYGHSNSLNGSSSSFYSHNQVSDLRASASRQLQPLQGAPGQVMSVPTILFSHYHPQERDFASTSNAHAQVSYNTTQQQPYGSALSNYQFSPSQANSHSPRMQNNTSTQPVWNVTTPTHAPGYTARTEQVDRRESEYRNSQIPLSPPWIPPRPQVPEAPQQHYSATQFKHYPSSYQPPP